MRTVFISDLHLAPEREDITSRFKQFTDNILAQDDIDALYILGDLFEVWIGDDISIPPYSDIVALLHQLAQHTHVYFMHGNRDFLVGNDFARKTGIMLLPDPQCIDLYGQKTLISHGDIFCTDDNDYQAFRHLVRNKDWQTDFLGKPAEERIHIAKHLRDESKQRNQGKSMEIMDVNQTAVEEKMVEFGVTRLVHGHTHRPAHHQFDLNGQPAERIVLSDWYSQGGYTEFTAEGIRSVTLES